MTTARTARYFTAGASVADTQTVWFVLHGYGQLASRFLRHFDGSIPAGTRVVAPEGLSRFYLEMPRADRGHMARVGAAWMTREDRLAEIADTRGWLDSVYREVINEVMQATNVMPVVGVLAFSQGVATAMRWIAGGGVRPLRAVMWAGSIADDVDVLALQLALQETEVVLVAGTEDHFMTEKARRMLLTGWETLGIAVREVQYTGAHELEATALAELLKISPP
ncbi:MAG: phospholipase [Phycisphaerae bacterium]|nr:phospholipase [Gemmatimonadaceae bacterium]